MATTEYVAKYRKKTKTHYAISPCLRKPILIDKWAHPLYLIPLILEMNQMPAKPITLRVMVLGPQEGRTQIVPVKVTRKSAIKHMHHNMVSLIQSAQKLNSFVS